MAGKMPVAQHGPHCRSSKTVSTTDVAFRRGTTDDRKNCFSVMLESFVDLAKRIAAQGNTDPDPDPERGWTRTELLYRLLSTAFRSFANVS